MAPKKGAVSGLDKLKTQSNRRTLKSYKALGGLEVVQISGSETVEEALERYRASGLVEFAEPDYKLHAAALPNDPQFTSGLQWSLRNSSTGRDIHAVEGWDTENSASNIIVAVIDTGIRYTHEDLAANMWTNPGEIPGNGIDDDDNGIADDIHGMNTINRSGDPMDDGDHGTHVAGIIGAVGNNGKGITGVAWKVKLMACKFLDSNGDGDTSDVIEAIDYARRMGAKVINGSFGGPDYSAALYTAIQNARNAGIVFVAAAGNDSMNIDQMPIYPACYALDNIVVVGGTSRSDLIDTDYSNYGANSVDLCAPGSGIYSTWGSSDVSYYSISGTSMATPHVTGAVALMRARFPSMTPAQIISRLINTVDVLPNLQGKCRSGGRLNLAKALGPDPAANFGASTWSGEPPLQVQFNNLTVGDVRSLTWNFGDGSSETTNASPAHTFVRTGEFKVRLTVVGTNSKTNSLEQTVRVVPNYRFAAEQYSWIDPGGMTRVLLTDNGVSAPVSIPFPFSFYGVEKDSIYISANGALSFSPDGLSSTDNAAMPNVGAPNDLITPYWDNLNPATSGAVYYGTEGTAPNRRFVVSWVNVPRVTSSILLTFQAILEESTGDIVFQYKDVAGTRGAGRGATVGVENATGDVGVYYTHNGSPYLLANRTAVRASRSAYRYLVLNENNLWLDGAAGNPTPSSTTISVENVGNLWLDWSVSTGNAWLTVSDVSGALAGGETTQLSVSLNSLATNLAAGSYQTTLTFSNLTDGGGNITIPVTVRLTPAPVMGILEFTPATTNRFAGGLGGPFAPSSLAVNLRNSGAGPLDWNASGNASWLAAAPASGTLGAGESTIVLLQVTASADGLPTGEHIGAIQFRNATTPTAPEFTQEVRLQVNTRLEHSSAKVQDGRFQAELAAPADGNYAVEYSTDLETWAELSTQSAVNGSVSFEDAIGLGGNRFYRLRAL